jgi:hypothetical protein
MNSFSCLKTCKLLNKVYMRLLTCNQPFKGCLNNGHLNYWKTLQNEKDSKWFFHGSKIAWKTTFISHIEHHLQLSNKITTKENTTMLQRVVSLVKTHNIPSCSIININQIKVHLIPTRGDQMCKTNLKLNRFKFWGYKTKK